MQCTLCHLKSNAPSHWSLLDFHLARQVPPISQALQISNWAAYVGPPHILSKPKENGQPISVLTRRKKKPSKAHLSPSKMPCIKARLSHELDSLCGPSKLCQLKPQTAYWIKLLGWFKNFFFLVHQNKISKNLFFHQKFKNLFVFQHIDP